MAQPPTLKGRALRLLGTREHSRLELERKLRRHETRPGELAAVLDGLQARGFINEQRVVESVVFRRSAKLGVARIRQELHDKGLDGDAVRDAVADLQSTELARAHAVWRRRFGNGRTTGEPGEPGEPAPPPDRAERARQIRFLASRGFAGDTIRRVVSAADALLDEQASD